MSTGKSPAYGRGTGTPDPIDLHVGQRLRERRIEIGMTQAELAETLGLTFQQVQKYERGQNRAGASRLYELARALDVAVGYFFDEMPPDIESRAPERGLAEAPAPFLAAADASAQALVDDYYAISDPGVRRRVFDMAKALAAACENG